MSDHATPVLKISWDRLYPRCVWCRGEQYMPGVIAYSAGEVPCTAAGGCGRYVPDDYRYERTGRGLPGR